MLQGKFDILVLFENKLDSFFTTNQFLIKGYFNSFRFDRNRNGGGILSYIREDIPWKNLKLSRHPPVIEGIFVEVKLRKIKWLVSATYHPPSQVDEHFFGEVCKTLDKN